VHVDNIEEKMEFNSVFGSQLVDFRESSVSLNEAKIEINAVFGYVEVYLPDNVIIKIKASSAFGKVNLPEGNDVVFRRGGKNHISRDKSHSHNLYRDECRIWRNIY